MQKLESGSERGEPFTAHVCVNQPHRNLEIFAFGGDRLAGKLDYLGVIGNLQGALPCSLGCLKILPAGFFYFVRYRIVSEIDSTRIVAGNGIEKIVSERHTYAAEENESPGSEPSPEAN